MVTTTFEAIVALTEMGHVVFPDTPEAGSVLVFCVGPRWNAFYVYPLADLVAVVNAGFALQAGGAQGLDISRAEVYA